MDFRQRKSGVVGVFGFILVSQARIVAPRNTAPGVLLRTQEFVAYILIPKFVLLLEHCTLSVGKGALPFLVQKIGCFLFFYCNYLFYVRTGTKKSTQEVVSFVPGASALQPVQATQQYRKRKENILTYFSLNLNVKCIPFRLSPCWSDLRSLQRPYRHCTQRLGRAPKIRPFRKSCMAILSGSLRPSRICTGHPYPPSIR